MTRRTSKSFTVEVRKSGRLVKAAAASWPHDPTMADDQPRVSWSGLTDAPEPAAEAQETTVAFEPSTGRVLPALDEPEPREEWIEPKQRGREPAKPTATAAEQLSAEVEAPAPGMLAVEKPSEATAIALSAKITADTFLPRDGRKRMLRSELKREERWKARLPIAVFSRDRWKRIAP